MLPAPVPSDHAPDLRNLASWIVDNADGDPINLAIGRLLSHAAQQYGGVNCSGRGVDRYSRHAQGTYHDRLIALGEALALTVICNHHSARRELRPWQRKVAYGGGLLAGSAWLKDSTTSLDQVGRALARLLAHIGEHYQDVVINGRDHHVILVRLARQALFAAVTDYPRQAPVDLEQDALDILRAQLGARPVETTTEAKP